MSSIILCDVRELSPDETVYVAGGPWPIVVRAAAWVVTSGVAAETATKIIEVGEKIHDAVCAH